jgi:hypothetical protein
MNAGNLMFASIVLAVPVVLGAALGRLGRPWWWGGLVVGALGLLVCATDPEEGFVSGKNDHFPEFFLLCTAIMVGLVAVGTVLGRGRRSPA